MKGIYLASCIARHHDYDIIYNDYDCSLLSDLPDNKKIIGDMLDVDLSYFDFVIASPPCNFWSRANYRRFTSPYSLSTKHLLPGILEKLSNFNKPFIIENVRNDTLFTKYGIYDLCNKFGYFVYIVGRHTYFTNIMINLECYQEIDFHDNLYAKRLGIKTERQSYRQGGDNVHRVIEIFLKYCKETIDN